MAWRQTPPANWHTFATFLMLDVCVGMMVAVLIQSALPPPNTPVAYAAPKRIIKPTVVPAVTGTPSRVVVPGLAIDVPVRTGAYSPESKSWTIDGDSAFYADRTVPPNDNNGTTLLYGHADWPIFGRLPDAAQGMTADVYTKEGLKFSYVYQSRLTVRPTDTSILTSEGAPTLALQTCYGAFDSYRLVITFSFVGVSKL